MTPWQQHLREGDPGADATLSNGDAASMRQLVVVAAQTPAAPRRSWPQRLAVAAMLTLMVASGIAAGRRLLLQEVPVMPAASPTPAAPDEPRQLQFATPGGTRIIWTFNPDFDLKETTR